MGAACCCCGDLNATVTCCRFGLAALSFLDKGRYVKCWGVWRMMHTANPKANAFWLAQHRKESWRIWKLWHKHDLTTHLGHAHYLFLLQQKSRRTALVITVTMRVRAQKQALCEKAAAAAAEQRRLHFEDETRHYLGMISREQEANAQWG